MSEKRICSRCAYALQIKQDRPDPIVDPNRKIMYTCFGLPPQVNNLLVPVQLPNGQNIAQMQSIANRPSVEHDAIACSLFVPKISFSN